MRSWAGYSRVCEAVRANLDRVAGMDPDFPVRYFSVDECAIAAAQIAHPVAMPDFLNFCMKAGNRRRGQDDGVILVAPKAHYLLVVELNGLLRGLIPLFDRQQVVQQ